jgi:iron complex outermembrane receptor protein
MKNFASLIGMLLLARIAVAGTSEPVQLPPVVVGYSDVQPHESLAVFERDGLDGLGLISLENLPMRVPNLSLSPSVTRSFGAIYGMRGAANTQFFSDPSLVLYVDDVPFADAFTYSTDLLAVKRIEVWRGPQGSVFGRNSQAGVINVITRRPSNRWEGWVSGGQASFDSQTARVGAMGPVVKDKLYLSLAGGYADTAGWVDNVELDQRADDQEAWRGRGELVWKPDESWEVSLLGGMEKFDDGIRIVKLSGDPYKVHSDAESLSKAESNFQAAKISKVFDTFSLTSITSRRDYKIDPLTLDLDLTPTAGNTALIKQQQELWSQELRAQSLDDCDWRWSAGFYFGSSKREGDDTRGFYVPVPGFVFTEQTLSELDDDNYALLGRVTYAGRERWEFTLGARLDYTEKKIERNKNSILGPAPEVSEDQDFFNVSPKLSVGFQATKNVRVFASTGLGYKPGGYSAFINPPASPEYDTERLWSSELGVKTLWREGKLRADLTGFYNDFKDYQVERSITGTTDLTIFNADAARAYGAEAELGVILCEGLELSGVLGYTHAVFEDFDDPSTGASLKGNRLPYIPNLSGTVALQYRHRCGFLARVEYQQMGRVFYDEVNTPAFTESSYGLLNARIGYETQHYSVYLFGRNLTDTEHFVRIVPELNYPNGGGVPGEPVAFGVMVKLQY